MVDFKSLQEALLWATQSAYSLLKESNISEEFYSFALVAQADANHISPAASGRMSLESQLKNASFPQNDLLSKYDLKWLPGNWKYFGVGDEFFDCVQPLLNNDTLGAFFENEELAFERFKADVFAAMTLSLMSLRSCGKFDPNLLLFCSVEDSECGEWLAIDSAKRLNEPCKFQVFRKECIEGLEFETNSMDIVHEFYQERLLLSGLK